MSIEDGNDVTSQSARELMQHVLHVRNTLTDSSFIFAFRFVSFGKLDGVTDGPSDEECVERRRGGRRARKWTGDKSSKKPNRDREREDVCLRRFESLILSGVKTVVEPVKANG
ncbi:hypothetical protein GWI33_008388 [Rhynchophorus ferrugineus]|uniref:Uncharacterized protein n=1 Tax=Rhynchophorus ferrugineus TaxID=354439 RepID=A0A834MB57_RHYFE|nr:hypothetical protein GWI33_008388 [Rhynchophorus ferrugineus]